MCSLNVDYMDEPNHYLLPEAYDDEYWKVTSRGRNVFEKRPEKECPNCSRYSIKETVTFSRGFITRILFEEKIQHTKICDHCGYLILEESLPVEDWIMKKLNGKVNRKNSFASSNKIQTEILE